MSETGAGDGARRRRRSLFEREQPADARPGTEDAPPAGSPTSGQSPPAAPLGDLEFQPADAVPPVRRTPAPAPARPDSLPQAAHPTLMPAPDPSASPALEPSPPQSQPEPPDLTERPTNRLQTTEVLPEIPAVETPVETVATPSAVKTPSTVETSPVQAVDVSTPEAPAPSEVPPPISSPAEPNLPPPVYSPAEPNLPPPVTSPADLPPPAPSPAPANPELTFAPPATAVPFAPPAPKDEAKPDSGVAAPMRRANRNATGDADRPAPMQTMAPQVMDQPKRDGMLNSTADVNVALFFDPERPVDQEQEEEEEARSSVPMFAGFGIGLLVVVCLALLIGVVIVGAALLAK